MPQVVCSLCSCRLDWESVDHDALLCACGHSLDDDHLAAPTAVSPTELTEHPGVLPIFVGRKVI